MPRLSFIRGILLPTALIALGVACPAGAPVAAADEPSGFEYEKPDPANDVTQDPHVRAAVEAAQAYYGTGSGYASLCPESPDSGSTASISTTTPSQPTARTGETRTPSSTPAPHVTASTTTPSGSAHGGGSSGSAKADTTPGDAKVEAFVRDTLQCVAKNNNDVSSDRIEPTAKAFAKAFAKLKKDDAKGSGGSAKNSDGKDDAVRNQAELTHLLSQSLQETGGLKALTEGGDAAKDKHEGFQGRGFIQVTHKENYQKCIEFVKQNDPASSAAIEKIAAGGDAADQAIGNAAAKNEPPDLYLSAMCTLSWWENAKQQSSKFEEALKTNSEDSCKVVSRAINAGPGASEDVKVNGMDVRLKRFNEVKACAGKKPNS